MLYWRYDDVNLVHHPIHKVKKIDKVRRETQSLIYHNEFT